jgi:hypothetical protein
MAIFIYHSRLYTTESAYASLNSVMTIQNSESGTEFGLVGFKQSKTASYLVFPKSLKRFEDKRVIGINWDLVQR